VVVDVDDSYLTICSKLTEHIGVFMSSVPNFGVYVICAIVFRCLGHSKNVHDDDDDDDDLHCESKKQDTKLLPMTSPNINRFSNFFH